MSDSRITLTNPAPGRQDPQGAQVLGPVQGRHADILTPAALAFLVELHRRFEPTRQHLLADRVERRQRLAKGGALDFRPETRAIREAAWRVAPLPADLQDRRVEITGPVDRKMMINALNSGACVFMADFEDAHSPTWDNTLQGQVNLCDAVAGTLEHVNPDGKVYRLGEDPAVLVVRPRGWHLPEKHLRVDGQPLSASLFDAGLWLFHNARALLAHGTGPYLYLPKLESHLEARLWNDVFVLAEERLGLRRGAIKATVLIETLPAAFEMDEILYELREHAAGLNAGRWDYIFSIIRTFGAREDALLPDRAQVTMTVPFMKAYTDLLVSTCHRRGAMALGGMAAFIPNRKDPQVTEVALAKVREDKLRESGQGFDGTWVAHPDLVPVALEVFDSALGQAPNQLGKLREDVRASAAQLQDFRVQGGQVTEAGLRTNVEVGLVYIAAWLGGSGAVAIHNLMEDTATAEISRSQVWQWVRLGTPLEDGRRVTPELVRGIIADELAKLRASLGPAFDEARFRAAQAVFEDAALRPVFLPFLTIPAYEQLP